MLTAINEEIMYLKEKLREFDKLESLRKIKSQELNKKKDQRYELKKILDKERNDFEKLQSLSLASVFSSLLGKKEDQLDKEKEEYLLAKLKYEDAVENISKLEEEIEEIKAILEDYSDINKKHRELVVEKEELIIQEGGISGIRLKDELLNIDELKIDIKEVKEAIDAGERTLDSLERVRDRLQSAKGWGTWDMLGGGLISNIAKHSAINDANAMTADVQHNLKSFKKELSDVNEFTDIQVNLSSFASFADFFLDGIFVDWFVQTKINTSLDNVNGTIGKIESIINDLRRNLTNLEINLKESRLRVEEILEL